MPIRNVLIRAALIRAALIRAALIRAALIRAALIRAGLIGAGLAALVVGACSSGPEEAERHDGAIVAAGALDVFEARVGDCLDLDITAATAAQIDDLIAIPCAEPHRHEVFHLGEIDDIEVYPGPSELAAAADGMCVGAFEDYVGVPYLDSPLQFTYLFPSLGSWQELEDRTVLCILVSSQPLTGPMGSGPDA